MFSWLTNLFMSSSAEAALETAIYSVGLASGGGMHQMKAPEAVEKMALERSNS